MANLLTVSRLARIRNCKGPPGLAAFLIFCARLVLPCQRRSQRHGAARGKTPAAPEKVLPSSAVMSTYARQDLVFARGEGSWLYTTSGERYLDFGSGVAVNSLGHAHPRLVAALTAQAAKLWHTSNLYRVEGQEDLAKRLCELTFAERVFLLQLRRGSL